MAQKASEPILPATPAASQPKFDYKPSSEESELIRLSQEWMDAALFRKDEKRLREIMAPDFTLQIWDASRAPQPLEAWLDALEVSKERSGRAVLALGRFSVWVAGRGLAAGDLDGDLIDEYVRAEQPLPWPAHSPR